MNPLTTSGLRIPALIVCLSVAALLAALPLTAQQPQIPFDESRLVFDLTNALQLPPDQSNRLNAALNAHLPRIESIKRQMAQLSPDVEAASSREQLRVQLDRERRAVIEEFLTVLPADQQTRLRALMAMPQTTTASPNVAGAASPVAPVKPTAQDGALSAGERLIALPNSNNQTRARHASESGSPLSSLNEDQKILQLLNRAGFGPRPGELERVKAMGIEKYLNAQLNPEALSDDLVVKPLGSLSTLQMSNPEIAQAFAPPPTPRATPTPAPTPTPTFSNDGATGRPGDEAMRAQRDKEMERPTEREPKMSKDTMTEQAMTGQVMTGQAPDRPVTSSPNRPVTSSPPPPVVQSPRRAIDTQRPLRELQQAKLLRAVFSEKQLQEVMVDFWFNHFNVWGNKDNARYLITSYERDAIRPYALGKFKDLLTATAQSPAMLYYLDNFLSQMEQPAPPVKYDADGNPLPPARRPGLNENYARELLELHTLGVDGGYTQKDVTEVARCFTGWTVAPQPNPLFVFRPRIHDKGEKLVLGQRIGAGGGIEDGLRVLDLIAHHPATAKFIARKLCQRFIADQPPQELIDRVAKTFRATDGDIREVVRAILTSPEFYSPKYYRNKIKSPLELTASALRATSAATDGANPLIQWVARMGEPLYLYQPPTGYNENSAEWLSNAMLLERMNFGLALLAGKINGTRLDVSRLVASGAVNDRDRLIDQLVATIIHSDISGETRHNLAQVLDESRSKMTPVKYDARAAQKKNEQVISGIAALVLGSREFQVK